MDDAMRQFMRSTGFGSNSTEGPAPPPPVLPGRAPGVPQVAAPGFGDVQKMQRQDGGLPVGVGRPVPPPPSASPFGGVPHGLPPRLKVDAKPNMRGALATKSRVPLVPGAGGGWLQSGKEALSRAPVVGGVVERLTAKDASTGITVFGIGALISLMMWMQKQNWTWALVLLLCLGIVWYMYEETGHGSSSPAKEEAMRGAGGARTGLNKGWYSRNAERGDVAPFRPGQTPMLSNQQTAAMMGVDPNRVEGPRPGFGYKRVEGPGYRPPPAYEQGLQNPRAENFGGREYGEYMDSLQGYAQEPFHQTHPFVPTAAQWDHTQHTDDMEDVYEVSTQPGKFGQRFPYRDPKTRQAGAKSMHLQDPPRTERNPIDHSHPWMEEEVAELRASPPSPAAAPRPAPTTVGGGGGRELAMGVSEMGLMGGHKIDSRDVGDILKSRQSEDEALRNMHGGPRPGANEELPPELQPIPTSREGMRQAMEEKRSAEALARSRQKQQPAAASGGGSGGEPAGSGPAPDDESEFLRAFQTPEEGATTADHL